MDPRGIKHALLISQEQLVAPRDRDKKKGGPENVMRNQLEDYSMTGYFVIFRPMPEEKGEKKEDFLDANGAETMIHHSVSFI